MIFLGGLEKLDCWSAACNTQGTTGDQVKSKAQPSISFFYRGRSTGGLVIIMHKSGE